MKDYEWLLKVLIAEYGDSVDKKQQELERLRQEYYRAVIVHEARRHLGKDESDAALTAARDGVKRSAVALKNAEETHQALGQYLDALRRDGRGRLLADLEGLLDRVA